jgi:hypothetical protein
MPWMGRSTERKIMPSHHFSGCLQFSVPCGEESHDLRRTNRKEPRLLGFPFCIKLAAATKQKEEMKGLWKELSWHLCLAQTTTLKVSKDLKSHFQPTVDVSSFFRGSHGSPDVPKGRDHENTLSSITWKEKRIFLVQQYISRIQYRFTWNEKQTVFVSSKLLTLIAAWILHLGKSCTQQYLKEFKVTTFNLVVTFLFDVLMSLNHHRLR